MKTILALTAVAIAGANAATHFSEEASQYLFTNWAAQEGKVYPSNQMFQKYETFKANLDYIVTENTKGNTYSLALNQFADLTLDEFKALMKLKPAKSFSSKFETYVPTRVSAPSSVDHRSKLPGVKNQGQCGSCWAFSTTAAVEGLYNKGKSSPVALSEQQLVDCDRNGNAGCNGGLMTRGFEYVQKNGMCKESDYPYKGKDLTCQKCTPVAKISGYKKVASKDENALVSAIAGGVVSVAVAAGNSAFQFYSGGIVTANCGTSLDHGVAAVGYGTENGIDYYLVRNSWGASWGEKGYIRLQRNKNMCGVALDASFPTA